jgi:hypothetical protein
MWKPVPRAKMAADCEDRTGVKVALLGVSHKRDVGSVTTAQVPRTSHPAGIHGSAFLPSPRS